MFLPFDNETNIFSFVKLQLSVLNQIFTLYYFLRIPYAINSPMNLFDNIIHKKG
jgi:hypothetical protein